MTNDSEDKDVENKKDNTKPKRPLRSKFIRYGAIAGILGTLLAALQPWAIEKGISSQIKVDPSSPGYMFWERLPLPIISKFYLFNIENPNEFLKGDKLRVREIGPFTMSQSRWKETIEFSDKTVKYYEWRNYTILDEQTIGSWDQEITVLNPLVASIGSIIGDKLEQLIPIPLAVSPFVYSTVSAVLLVHSQNFFLKTTPRKLIIGQRFNLLDTVTTLVKPLQLLGVKASDLIPTDDLPNNTFGLINGKNYTRMGPWEVYTGVDVPKELYTYAVGFKGERLMKRWAGPECNTPRGTDGLQFQPLINRTTKLTVFAGDIYRSLDLTYVSDVDYFGIQTFKYIIAPEMFQPPSVNPNNACYCVHTGKKKSRCEYYGLLDLTGGFSGSPFVVTKPHFLDAPEIQKQVDGLSPDPDKHTFYMLIKPDIGLPISVKGRLQFNLRVEKLPFLRGFNNIKDTIVPLGWLEEGADLDGILYYVMRGGLVLAPKVTSAGFYAAAIGGWATFLGGLIYSCLRKCCKDKTESSDRFFVSRESPNQEVLIGQESKLSINQSRLPNQQSILRALEPVNDEQPSEPQNGLMFVNNLRPFPIRTSAISIIPVDSNMFQPTSGIQFYRFPAVMNQGEHLEQLLLPITNTSEENNRLEAGTRAWNERTSKSVKEKSFKGKERVARGRSLPSNNGTKQCSKRIKVDSKETQDRFVQADRDIKGYRYAETDAIMKSYSGFRQNIKEEINVFDGQEIVKNGLNTYENIKHHGCSSSSANSYTPEVTSEANAFSENGQVKVESLLNDMIEDDALYDEVHGETKNKNLQSFMETEIQSRGHIVDLNNLVGQRSDEFFQRNISINNESPTEQNISIKSGTSQSKSILNSTSTFSRNQPMEQENDDESEIYESDSDIESKATKSEIDDMLDTRQEVKSNHETKAYGLPDVENPEGSEIPSFSDEFSIGFDSSRASTPNSLIKKQKSRKDNSCILS